MRAAVALLLALLLGGCLDTAADRPRPSATDSKADVQPEEARVSSNAPIPRSVPADPFSNVTRFSWANFTDLGPTAFEVRLALPDAGAHCEIAVGAGTQRAGSGLSYLYLTESAEVSGGGTNGGGSYGFVHVGQVHSDDVIGGDSSGGGTHGTSGTMSGQRTLTLVVPDARAHLSTAAGEASLAIDVVCEAPFTVLGARMGHEVLLEDQASLRGGVGAGLFVGASVNAQDSAALEFKSPTVRAGAGGVIQAARVVADLPSGQQTWMLDPVNDLMLVDDGAGRLAFTIDHAGAYIDSLWVTAFGFDGDLDLRPGLQEQRLLETPGPP